jgi:hypothetical protein
MAQIRSIGVKMMRMARIWMCGMAALYEKKHDFNILA